ncbi:hypothetical protein K3495_g9331 [Podosphaera aphanis]|nr:hypothetical protein K3495_g9331 [Podosphaera aphanis]
MATEILIECPFCGSMSETDYQIMLHIENSHPENRSTLLGVDDQTQAAPISMPHDGDQYACCPLDGCGETVSFADLDSHINYHSEEYNSRRLDLDRSSNESKDQNKPHSHGTISPKHDRVRHETIVLNKRRHAEDPCFGSKSAWKGLLKKSQTPVKSGSSSQRNDKRKVKSELGPHANEKQMPIWLAKLLRDEDGKVKTINKIQNGELNKVEICPNMMVGVIPVLAQLLDQDKSSEYAYLCHPSVMHVSKLRREGGFCGYRNIQMLCSYVNATELQGHESFNSRIPSIFEIQDYIETAWDIDINPQGRFETGGIRGTRKYIGTPEAQAMFFSLGIACNAEGIRSDASKLAHEILFDTVERYFNNNCDKNESKLRQTLLPPVYLQHSGHSMTIIGFERKRDKSKNVIVFDPATRDNNNITTRIGQTFQHETPENLLKAYRKGVNYFKKYNEFELLKLTSLPS